MSNIITYDEYDHMLRDEYYDYEDSGYQPVIRKDTGYFAIQYVYNKYGKKKKEQYLDTDSNLVMHKENGYAECRWSYNQKGQLTSVQYYDVNGALVNISGGYAK